MDSPPTIKTLAEVTGFSIATISKALRDSPVVRPETKKLIQKAATNFGYRAHAQGVSLRTGRTLQAAVLMPVTVSGGFEWDGVEYTQILSGFSQALESSPYSITVHVIKSAEDGRDVARRIVDMRMADGIVFSGIRTVDPRIDFLLERDFPFVTLGRCHRDVTYAHVDVDNEWAAESATARLIEGGHRSIALVNPPSGLAYAMDRVVGFRRAFAEAGIASCNEFIAEGDLTARFGKETALRFRRNSNPPTAFVCVNEATTLGVLSGLHDLDLVAGRDVDVIGYDDIKVSAYFTPPLTTYFYPIERLGRQLGEFLLRRMAGEPAAALQQVHHPELIARQSNRLMTYRPATDEIKRRTS